MVLVFLAHIELRACGVTERPKCEPVVPGPTELLGTSAIKTD